MAKQLETCWVARDAASRGPGFSQWHCHLRASPVVSSFFLSLSFGERGKVKWDPVLMIVAQKGCLSHFREGEEYFPILFLYIEGYGSHPGSVCA